MRSNAWWPWCVMRAALRCRGARPREVSAMKTGSQQTSRRRVRHRLKATVYAELAEDVLDVVPSSAVRDGELRGDGVRRRPVREEQDHLPLTDRHERGGRAGGLGLRGGLAGLGLAPRVGG